MLERINTQDESFTLSPVLPQWAVKMRQRHDRDALAFGYKGAVVVAVRSLRHWQPTITVTASVGNSGPVRVWLNNAKEAQIDAWESIESLRHTIESTAHNVGRQRVVAALGCFYS